MKKILFNNLAIIIIICSCQSNLKQPNIGQQDNLRKEISLSPAPKALLTEIPVPNDYKKKNLSSEAVQPITGKTLKEVYKNYFPVGAAVTPEKDLNDPDLVKLITREFSSLTAKTSMQPFWIHPDENTYRWDEADKLVDFAQKNNMKVRGHCLIYSTREKHMPAWFYKDGKNKASKELILKRMKDHITAVVTRYKGKVYCWDVVNEAMRKNDSLYAILGEEYITKAFEYAHEADPTAKLFYNDGFYDDVQRNKFYTLIKKWKSEGVPIDGIGIQYHLGIEGKSAAEIQKDIDTFSSLGLEVQITELDISIYPRTSTPKSVQDVSDAFTPGLEDKQAQVYKTIFDVCRKNKDKVTGVTIWGTVDGDSFLVQRLNKKNYPYLFSDKLTPKKAFDAVVNF